jgi:hypothetical protein
MTLDKQASKQDNRYARLSVQEPKPKRASSVFGSATYNDEVGRQCKSRDYEPQPANSHAMRVVNTSIAIRCRIRKTDNTI